jgi:hypothetical protein
MDDDGDISEVMLYNRLTSFDPARSTDDIRDG